MDFIDDLALHFDFSKKKESKNELIAPISIFEVFVMF